MSLIKSLTNTVHYQGMALKQMDKALREKFSYSELNPLLNNKIDASDLSQIIDNINIELEKRPTNEELIPILKEKIDKKELIYYLESKPSTNDLYNTRKKIDENQKNIEKKCNETRFPVINVVKRGERVGGYERGLPGARGHGLPFFAGENGIGGSG